MQFSDADECATLLQGLIDRAGKIVFFGGAGVSTESGIPDFRSPDGLYNQKYDVPPETILSHTYFCEHTDKFYEYYREKMLPVGIKPNAAHRRLAELESIGKLSAIVTQNIDTLHRDAGSRNVLELHGSVSRNHCTKCGRYYGLDFILNTDGVPKCDCGGVVKPDVVLYEESLDGYTCDAAIRAISECDLLIIAGTSLTVYPAAGFVRYAKGKTVLINRAPTSMDALADYVLRCSVGALFEKIKAGDNKNESN